MADDLTRAYDMLLAAAQAVVNDGLEAAEEGIHPCDVHNEAAKAERMPAPLQALRHAAQAVRRAAPSSPVADDGLPPLPRPDGSADFPVDAGGITFAVVDAWSETLVRQAQREAYEAGRAAAVPDGWRVIPAEPTPAMLRHTLGGRKSYDAMLAAVHQPPEKDPV